RIAPTMNPPTRGEIGPLAARAHSLRGKSSSWHEIAPRLVGWRPRSDLLPEWDQVTRARAPSRVRTPHIRVQRTATQEPGTSVFDGDSRPRLRLQDRFVRNTREGPTNVVHQPHGIRTASQRVPSRAFPLPHSLVRGWVDARQGKREHGSPDGVGAVADFTPLSLQTGCNSSNHLSGLCIDAAHTAVALIERPDGASASGQKPRFKPDRNRTQHVPGTRIDRGQEVLVRAGNPNNAVAVEGIE